jgi:Uma2 family endonuclease
MAIVMQRERPGLSVETFRAFYDSRPDEEHWELIDGVPMMMAPATATHQRIASNLERLLNDSLELHDRRLAAYQRVGVNLGPTVDDYDPEPDVVVVDVVRALDQRYVDRFYLAAEVISDSDSRRADIKRELYRQHDDCICVLTIRQDRPEMRIDVRSDDGWQETLLQKPGDVVVLDRFGVHCTLGDLYRGTPLQPRP